jgi:enoyl-CoA hydratase/carnithine racemase
MGNAARPSTLRYRTEANVGWIVLDRPQQLNALDRDGWRQLRDALLHADADDACGVIAITGEGRAFCAGDDIKVFQELRSAELARDFFLNGMFPALEAIVTVRKPVCAAVNGIAYGGGCEIVLLCDLAVAAQNARFSLPEGLIGAWPSIFVAVPPGGVASKAAKAFALSCESIDAATAKELGLVNAVAAPDALRGEVTARAAAILRSSPHAIVETKRWLNRNLATTGLAAVRESLECFARTGCNTRDLLEGTRAFLDKRAPNFTGTFANPAGQGS